MTIETRSRIRTARRAFALLALVLLAPVLAGCITDGDTTGSVYPADLRERHPIILTNGPRVLDLFAQGPSGLPSRERAELTAYLAEYARYGDGPLSVQVPIGAEAGVGASRVVAIVREGSSGRVSVSSYRPSAAGIASPIRLTFRRLQARVSDRCGLWPDDLGAGDYSASIQNRSYYNFGCSLQANIAAQAADPLDLVRGRPETPPDTAKRMQSIAKLRSGMDPATTYKQDGQNKINNSLGN